MNTKLSLCLVGALGFWANLGYSANLTQTSSGSFGNISSQWSTVGNADFSGPPLNFGANNKQGLGVVWDTDALFIGLSNEGANRKDAIIAWGDDLDDKLRFLFNGSEKMRLNSDGNLGVGTAAPTAKIHVFGSSVPRIKVESDADGWPGYELSEANVLKWTFTNNASDHLMFRAKLTDTTTQDVIFDTLGKVGIGTSSPTHTLSVNGAVRAKEIIVDTSWADDVFAPDYRLASLAEVEQHIQAKGHLPAVPSAAEVAEKGISIGESQAMLLRKVEELTLHVIALNKQVQAQQKRLMELDAPQSAKP